MGIQKATLVVGLAELTAIQHGLAALRISVDLTIQSIDQQLAAQLASAEAELKRSNGASHEVATQ